MKYNQHFLRRKNMNETAIVKQNKHEALDSAIDNVQSVLHALEILYEKFKEIYTNKSC